MLMESLKDSRISKITWLFLMLFLSACSPDIKMGFIDKTGKVVIEPIFDFADNFSDGLAAVRMGDKRGYIDKTGKMIIEPNFDATRGFSEGLAAIRKGDRWGYIDKTGKMIIEPKVDNMNRFSEGLAAITVGLGRPVTIGN